MAETLVDTPGFTRLWGTTVANGLHLSAGTMSGQYYLRATEVAQLYRGCASPIMTKIRYRTVESYELCRGSLSIVSRIRAGQHLGIGELTPCLVVQWERELIPWQG